jgi:hypothetical protein
MSPSLSRVALIVALASTSCFPSPKFAIKEREAALRYTSESDEFLLLEVLRDIRVEEENFAALEAVVKGERTYPPEGGFLAMMLEEGLEEYQQEEETRIREGREKTPGEILDGKALRLADKIEVLEAGLFSEEGELCFYRLSRMKGADAVCALVNEAVNFQLRNSIENAEQRAEEPGEEVERTEFFDVTLSAETSARWRERAASNGAWFTLGGRGCSVDLPLKSAEAAGVVRSLLENAEEDEEYFQLYRFLSGLVITESQMNIDFQPPADGDFKTPRWAPRELGSPGPGSEEYAKALTHFGEKVGFVEFDPAALFKRFGYIAPAEEDW